VIDTHVHFWKYARDAHPWIGPDMRVLQRDFLPADLEPLLRANEVDGCIAVQALHDEDETRWLLELADAHPWIVGVVGWVDLAAPDIAERLERLVVHKKLVGLRHLAHDERDEWYLVRDDVVAGLREVGRFDLAFDLLVREREMPAAIELARKLPEQVFVLDHLGKPPIRARDRSGWSSSIEELGKCENVVAKMSGLLTERECRGRPWDDLQLYVDTALRVFGPNRLMPGSDWPVCLLADDYRAAIEVAREVALVDGGAVARLRAYGI
jgi:L-fuconolactonase